jgi:hypothetical protein
MAYIENCTCEKCGKTALVDKNSFKGICAVCLKAEADKTRRMHLASLKGLSLEERLERLEAALYDLKAEERISALEIKNRPVGGTYG